jgi:hypothetical protein
MGDEWEDPDLAQHGDKRRRGGAHDKQTMWTGEEDLLLTNVVNGGAYMEKGKLQWKKLTIEHFPTRNDASVRNHYLRIEKATAEREREDGDKKRNKCRKCGQIKFGHRCTGSQLEWTFEDFIKYFEENDAITDCVREALECLDDLQPGLPRSGSAGSSGLGAAAAALAAGSGSGGSAAGSGAGGKLLRAAGLKVIASARIVKRFNYGKWTIADIEAIISAFVDALAAGSGSGGSAAGSSAGGKVLRVRAAGSKVIASARIVKRFKIFKSVKLCCRSCV